MRQTLKPTVIVVDDDVSVGRALQTLLGILGYNVVVFQSGEDLLLNEIPSGEACLLLDVYMPGIDGIELCRSLAATGRDLPVILMSGSDDQRTRRMIRTVKATARLFKPFDEKKLVRAIQRALPNHLNVQH